MKSIFVSSTFKDMQAERDALMKFVVPELNAFANQFGESIRLVDLRWGIDTSDASSAEGAKKILSVCLDEIDHSRPYMIVMLGERYGWIPPAELMRHAAREKDFSLDDPEKSITALEIEYGALNYAEQFVNCLFYFREALPLDNVPENDRLIYASEGVESAQKLTALKNAIIKAGGRVRRYHGGWNSEKGCVEVSDDFVRAVIEDVKALFAEDFEELQNQSWQDLEAKESTMFMERKSALFSTRHTLLSQYLHTLAQPDTRLFELEGQSGTGKSTMLAHMAKELEAENNVLFLACGKGARTQNTRDLVQQIVYRLETLLGIPEHFSADQLEDDTLPATETPDLAFYRWIDRFTQYTAKYRDNNLKPFFIFCDGLDCLMDGDDAFTYHWLPDSLPPNIKIVVSRRSSFSLHKPDFLMKTHGHYHQQSLPYVEDAEEKKAIIRSILDRNVKELDDTVIQTICDHKGSELPLYIFVLMQRLLIFDSKDFDAISQYGHDMQAINRYLLEIVKNSSDDLSLLSIHLLKAAGEQLNRQQCEFILFCLCISRKGLRESDLAVLFRQTGRTWNQLNFTRFVRYMQPFFMVHNDGRFDLSIDSIRSGFYWHYNKTGHEDIHQLFFRHLQSLPDDDPVKVSEIIWHAYCIGDYAWMTDYIGKSCAKSAAVRAKTARSLMCAADGKAMTDCEPCIRQLLRKAAGYGAGHDFIHFISNDFINENLPTDFITRNTFLEDVRLLFPIAENLYQQSKSLQALDDLSQLYKRFELLTDTIPTVPQGTIERNKKAIDTQNRLLKEYETLGQRERFSAIYRKLSRLSGLVGRSEQELKFCQLAVEIDQRLAEELNTDKTWRNLAASYAGCGLVLERRMKTSQAMRLYTDAEGIYRRLAEASNADGDYRQLAQIRRRFEKLNQKNGTPKPQSAQQQPEERLLPDADTPIESLPADEQRYRAREYIKTADNACGEGRYADARKLYNQSIRISQRLARSACTAETIESLVLAYHNASACYDISMAEKILKKCEEEVNTFGKVFADTTNIRKALWMFHRTLEEREESLLNMFVRMIRTALFNSSVLPIKKQMRRLLADRWYFAASQRKDRNPIMADLLVLCADGTFTGHRVDLDAVHRLKDWMDEKKHLSTEWGRWEIEAFNRGTMGIIGNQCGDSMPYIITFVSTQGVQWQYGVKITDWRYDDRRLWIHVNDNLSIFHRLVVNPQYCSQT